MIGCSIKSPQLLRRDIGAALLAVTILLVPPPAAARDDEPGSPTGLQTGGSPSLTSTRKFPQNLGRNFLALFGTKNVLPLVIGGGASAIARPYDEDIQKHWGVSDGDTPIGTIGGAIASPYVVIPAIGALFVGGQYSKDERFRSFTYSLAQAAAIDAGLVHGLKAAVGRTRPDDSDNRSFPSAHASSSFMIATVLHRYYGTTAGIIGYGAATFVSFSRVRENVHWMSDVTMGATIGYIVGSTVSRRTGITLRVGKVTLIPSFDPHRRTVGVSLCRMDD